MNTTDNEWTVDLPSGNKTGKYYAIQVKDSGVTENSNAFDRKIFIITAPLVYYVTGAISSGEYDALNRLVVSGIISSGNNVYFNSENEMVFEPPFTADYGAYMETRINNTSLPANPSGLTATLENGIEVDLRWYDNSDNEDGFTIYRKLNDTTSQYAHIASVMGNMSAYKDKNLLSNQGYVYKVIAFNLKGNSMDSNYASLMTSFPVPTAPGDIKASALSSSEIQLTWKDSNYESTYLVFRRLEGESYTSLSIATLGENSTVYIDRDLKSGTKYYYKVRALASSPSASTDSAETSDTTLIAVPDFGGLTCDFDLPGDHFIPNEGSMLSIKNIKVRGEYPDGSTVILEEDFKNIKILSPVDPNWEDEPVNAGNNNIYRNKGNNDFILYADYFGTHCYLATFRRNPDATSKEESFLIEYSSFIFDANGKTKQGYSLVMNDGNTLCFRIGANETTEFLIQAVVDGKTIRPR